MADLLTVIALGSNLGASAVTIKAAMRELQAFSMEPVKSSSLWQTEPIDCPSGSSLFINAVLQMAPLPDETPHSLLLKTQVLERQFGRAEKKVHNQARTLDLDLICFGDSIMETECLTLPHPRAHKRLFVLEPLAEIAPDLILPGQTKTAAELLVSLGVDERLVRLYEE